MAFSAYWNELFSSTNNLQQNSVSEEKLKRRKKKLDNKKENILQTETDTENILT